MFLYAHYDARNIRVNLPYFPLLLLSLAPNISRVCITAIDDEGVEVGISIFSLVRY